MDRLIEFGLGMSMARQMMRLMNESMDNFQIPSAPKPLQQQPVYVQQVNPIKPTSYYLCIDGSTAGPFSESEVAQLIATKRINKETLAWIEGMPNGTRLRTFLLSCALLHLHRHRYLILEYEI